MRVGNRQGCGQEQMIDTNNTSVSDGLRVRGRAVQRGRGADQRLRPAE